MKNTRVTLPDRFKKEENFINFLIDYELTPCISFYLEAFPYPYSIQQKLTKDESNEVFFLELNESVIKTMEVKDDYINMKITWDTGKKSDICILYDSIKNIACAESRSSYYFPDGDYDFDIIYHIEKEHQFSILAEKLKSLNTK